MDKTEPAQQSNADGVGGNAPPAPWSSLWRQRELLWQLVRRDVQGRYRGSWLGLLWSFGHPVFMLAIYTVVLQGVFRLRWDAARDGGADFALFLFAGLIVHSLFSECLGRAPAVILENPNYVTKVRFPLEILALQVLSSALVHAGVSVSVLLVFQLALGHGLQATALLLPLILLPAAVFLLGAIWLLSALGVFVRDITHGMMLVSSALLFLSPIFYPLSAVPEAYRDLLALNPLTVIVESLRNVLLLGVAPDWWALTIYFVVALLLAALGWLAFDRLRRYFSEVV